MKPVTFGRNPMRGPRPQVGGLKSETGVATTINGQLRTEADKGNLTV